MSDLETSCWFELEFDLKMDQMTVSFDQAVAIELVYLEVSMERGFDGFERSVLSDYSGTPWVSHALLCLALQL